MGSCPGPLTTGQLATSNTHDPRKGKRAQTEASGFLKPNVGSDIPSHLPQSVSQEARPTLTGRGLHKGVKDASRGVVQAEERMAQVEAAGADAGAYQVCSRDNKEARVAREK